MRMIPGMTVVVPCDGPEAYRATISVAAHPGPVYLRLGRIPTPIVTRESDEFIIGRANTLREGRDIAIVANGLMVPASLDAAEILSREGIEARVINMHTVKPLDGEILALAARECGAVVTAEEHSILGGLGGAVAEFLSGEFPVPVERVGVKDTFGESGEPEEILEKYGLTAIDIVNSARRVLVRK